MWFPPQLGMEVPGDRSCRANFKVKSLHKERCCSSAQPMTTDSRKKALDWVTDRRGQEWGLERKRGIRCQTATEEGPDHWASQAEQRVLNRENRRVPEKRWQRHLGPPTTALDNSRTKVVKHILCMGTQLPISFLRFHLRQTDNQDLPDSKWSLLRKTPRKNPSKKRNNVGNKSNKKNNALYHPQGFNRRNSTDTRTGHYKDK